MLHRHLTLERYELLRKEDGSAAARLKEQAMACPRCAAGLTQVPVAQLLAAWVPPVSVDSSIDWKTTSAGLQHRPHSGRSAERRPLAAVAALVVTASAVQAA